MIRVLQVLPRLRRGGSQAMVMNIYRSIDHNKIQFDFIIFTKDHDDYYDEIIANGGRVYHFEKFNGLNFFKIKSNFNKFLREHNEYKIIHFHVYSTASIYIPVAKKNGLKTIIHSHSTSNGKGVMALIKNALQLPLRNQADYLFACSSEAGKWLYGKKAISRDNYFFIPNGIPLNQFNFSKEKRMNIRKKYNIEDCKVIGHVGGFEVPKNHQFIIKVFYELCKNDENYRLMLVGDGTFEGKIREIVNELNIGDKVIFSGLQADVSPYLSAMDVFFFPSLWEGLPVSVVEAQASGLKCIISDSITKDIFLTDLVSYVSLDEPIEEWKKRICDASSHSRTEINAENLVKMEDFDIENVTKKIETFYISLLKNE